MENNQILRVVKIVQYILERWDDDEVRTVFLIVGDIQMHQRLNRDHQFLNKFDGVDMATCALVKRTFEAMRAIIKGA